MKVIDLIIKLQQLDPNLDVKMDVSKQSSNIFKMAAIATCEEIETPMDEKFVMISPYEYDGIEENYN